MLVQSQVPRPADPLFPSPALLPLSDPGGVQNTLEHTPGALRPFAATLGVPRLGDDKKHDTTATRWTESTPGETSHEGNVVTDTVTDTYTDT
ncbi:MAG: hypothetical protein ACRDRH_30025 [Pseudonocardia sp.]